MKKILPLSAALMGLMLLGAGCLNQAPNTSKEGVMEKPAEEDNSAMIQKDLDTVDVGDINDEFMEVDKDLNQL